MTYDDNNIFAKILRKEIPCDLIYEDKYALAFNDINPQRSVHVLVIPKGPYIDLDDFTANASEPEISGLMLAVGKVAKLNNLCANGYRILSNIGAHGHQEVPHLHIHVLGGEFIGPMTVNKK